MPKAVLRKPDQGAGLRGVATGVQGLIAGKDKLEDKRKFDEDLEERGRQHDTALTEGARQHDTDLEEGARQHDTSLDEKKRTFNIDDEFRNLRLGVMIDQAQLDRSHEETMQVYEEGQKLVRHEKQLTTDKHISSEQERTRRYGIKKQTEVARERAAMQRAETLQDDAKMYRVSRQLIDSIGKPPETWTEQDWAAAYQAGYDSILGEGTTTGAPDIPQATEEQKRAVEQRIKHMVINNDQVRDQLFRDTGDALEQQEQIRAKYANGDAALIGLEESGINYDDIVVMGEWAKDERGEPIVGLPELNNDFLAQALPPSTRMAMADVEIGMAESLGDIGLRSQQARSMVIEYSGQGLAPEATASYVSARTQDVQDFIDQQMDREEFRLLPVNTKRAIRQYYEQMGALVINEALAEVIIENEGLQKTPEQVLNELGLSEGVPVNPASPGEAPDGQPGASAGRSSPVR